MIKPNIHLTLVGAACLVKRIDIFYYKCCAAAGLRLGGAGPVILLHSSRETSLTTTP